MEILGRRASQQRAQLLHSCASQEEQEASVAAAGYTEDTYIQFSYYKPKQLSSEENTIKRNSTPGSPSVWAEQIKELRRRKQIVAVWEMECVKHTE